jgi:hypothetical protein
MSLEERLESLQAFTGKMFRSHAEEFERHKELLKEHAEWMVKIDRQIAAMNEATDRRLTAQDQDLIRHNEALAKIDARLDRIAELIDRFIQGQARDGHLRRRRPSVSSEDRSYPGEQ